MRTIESEKQLSKSILWELQRQYFDQKGVDAWAGQVPFYITSNPMIAHAYAQVFMNYFADLKAKGAYDPAQPIYLLELGTGSGRFSYYCLKEMVKLQKRLNLEDVKFCYVMTDFTQSNLDFWDQHNLLKPFVESGQLDFALYNMETDTEIQLTKSNVTLKPGALKNPLCVIGNYIFDTVTNDVFRIQDKHVFEAVVSLKTEESNVAGDEVLDLTKLQSSFSYRAMSSDYYEKPLFNEILQTYKTRLNQSSMMFPIGGLNALEHLQAMSGGRLFLVSTDKGYTHLSELEGRIDPRVVFHGSFSMSVNFHAMGEYFKRMNGDALFQELRKAIKTSVFVMGDDFTQLPHTSNAVESFVQAFGPGDFFNMHEFLKKMKEEMELKTVISHLRLTRWDPHVFKFFIEHIIKGLRSADNTVVEGFFVGMKHLDENVFPMPGAHDSYFDIAVFMHGIEAYSEALQYYQKSYKHFRKHFTLLYNMGMCHYYVGNKSMALACFKEAGTFDDPGKKDADQWIARIEMEQGSAGAGRLPGL